MAWKPLPIGVDSFEKLITGGYYYIDKTEFIRELLEKRSEVNLFTRPRRFGKTLNMSMLQCFFENTGNHERNAANRALFDGLKIMDTDVSVIGQMSSYPIISLSLKSAKQPSFSSAYYRLCEELWREYKRHDYVLGSLSGAERDIFQAVLDREADDNVYSGALRFLSDVLKAYYKKNVIILIDEYDVPLENAYFCGFYDQMVPFIRTLLEMGLKTNPSLEFAVITGCLRISRESIFTGLNNLNIISIVSEAYGEYFGFTQAEVDKMLYFYQCENKRDILKEWYDGYLFGNKEVYNPWSVINYIAALSDNPNALPKPYWSNTSSNDIVKSLIKQANLSAKQELEAMLKGETIEKPIHEDITYDSIYDSEDTLWNFLFFTGYLKQNSIRLIGTEQFAAMTIPNLEVRYIYDHTIRRWFREEIQKKDLSRLYQSMFQGEAEAFQQELNTVLQSSISYMDSREAFYHGFLVGILGNLKDYLVRSNRETGDGRSDITIRSLDVRKTPIIFELKVVDAFKDLDAACERALFQIESMNYDTWLPEEGYSDVRYYGIAFFKKQCRVEEQYKKF